MLQICCGRQESEGEFSNIREETLQGLVRPSARQDQTACRQTSAGVWVLVKEPEGKGDER